MGRTGLLRLQRPRWLKALPTVLDACAGAIAAWRAEARHRADMRALAQLDRHLLEDVGLAELVQPRPGVGWQDIERARW